MKTSLKFYLATIIAIVFIFYSCNKKGKDDVPVVTETGDEPLTADEAAFLATVPDTIIHLEDIILEDGENVRSFLEKNDPGFLTMYPSHKVSEKIAQTPFQQKLMYLARMIAMGNHLVDDDQHTYPSEGANKPAQDGLAYSWGSKDEIRQFPPVKVYPGCNDLEIHGLDCSGMIWVMTQAAKLTPPPVPKYNFFVKQISFADKWTTAFKNSADYKDLKMQDMMTNYPKDEMRNGDMILWKKHVGIYLYGSFYQSNGDPNAPGCIGNLSKSRGPQCLTLSYVLNWKGLGDYKVFRPVCDEDFILTLALDYTGLGPTSPYCKLGSYIDTTVFNITVTKEGDVVLKSIKNSAPGIIFQSVGCNCLGMTFSNGSIIDYTDFKATVADGLLAFDLTSTWCSSTDYFQCLPDPPMTLPGQVIPGNQESGNIDIPQGIDPITIPWGGNGTLTIKHDYK